MRRLPTCLLTLSLLLTNAAAQAARPAPFFDSFNNPVTVDSPYGQQLDRTPPRKRITPFGSAVLRVCGRLGDPVSRQAIRALLEDPDWSWALDPIHQRLFPELQRSIFLDRLTHIWAVNNAFRTIFCGDPRTNRMQGLHYHGRLADLQSQRLAGILPPSQGADEVLPGLIYGIPMQHRWQGRWVLTGIVRYSYKLDAHQILMHATEAALAVLPSPNWLRCRHQVETHDGSRFTAMVEVQGEGLLTFYPDRIPPPETRSCH